MMLTGLIGWPLGHSLSPAIHNAAFAASGVDGVYVLMPVRPDHVGDAVKGLAALGFRGSNVTIPHKQAVFSYIDTLSPAAKAIGAVNTIVIDEDGCLFGDNTDAQGFLADLVEQGVKVEDIADGGALILGAGGSARAVAYALASSGVPVRILARRPEQAEKMVASLLPHLPLMSEPQAPFHILQVAGIELGSLQPDLRPYISDFRLIVNCTPVGMTPNVDLTPWPDELPFHPDQIIYDLVYNPSVTRLMAQAQSYGARAVNGLGMLVHQGALSWQQWTRQPAPVASMHAALSGKRS